MCAVWCAERICEQSSRLHETNAPSENVSPVKIVIVPDSLRNSINEALDAAIKEQPAAEKDREVLYGHLLDFFDLHGYIPSFSIAKVSD